MHRVVIVAPRPELGTFNCAEFARELEARLDVRVVTARSVAATALATDAGPLAAEAPTLRLPGVDMIVWLRFAPRVYLRDWLAGIFDRLLNGAAGAQRSAMRARLRDVCRAAWVSLLSPALDPRKLAAQQPRLHVVELHSPAQACFWLRMSEERRRERRGPST